MNYFTLHNYFQNPLGKGAAVINVKAQRDRYETEYPIIKDKMSVTWYQSKYSLIAHILFPSRSVDMTYDVIMEFDMRNINPSIKRIDDIPCRVFSNCPSFSYTYANVFNHKDILCPWLRTKYQKDIFKKMPKVRNPYQLVSFERSIYLSTIWILKDGRNHIESIKSKAIKIITLVEVSSKIRTQSDIEEKYRELKRISLKDKEKELDKLQKSVASSPSPIRKKSKLLDTHKEFSKPHVVKSTKKVSKTSKVNKTSKSKKVRKI